MSTRTNIFRVCNIRDRPQSEKVQALGNHNSPLCNIDLTVSCFLMVLARRLIERHVA